MRSTNSRVLWICPLLVSDRHVFHSLSQKSDVSFGTAVHPSENYEAHGQPCLKMCLTLVAGQRSP